MSEGRGYGSMQRPLDPHQSPALKAAIDTANKIGCVVETCVAVGASQISLSLKSACGKMFSVDFNDHELRGGKGPKLVLNRAKRSGIAIPENI